ncbi:xyloglucan endotransglucosylase protein 7-like [Lolium rigidum]|uniref:xyloglucan endotransglucosylase protein 7-like n=1 Tax=Lolium rigidum TaxID=89674 RepID=UPI001F5C42B7|nr:xyloglucan endotransglucosylase protein 7-like [Lolium rigidum]
MASSPSRPKHRCCGFLGVALAFFLAVEVAAAGICSEIELLWGADRTYCFMDGDTEVQAMSLDKSQGSTFKSNQMYLFARIDVDIKLVEGDSAGTVCTIYTISEEDWDNHDEIDFEFLGNSTGEPYTLHTNIFAGGKGGREMQFRLWFDAAADFHTYTIIWNPRRIIIQVDGKTIRSFDNNEDQGVPFPSWRQQRVYGSLWSAEDWATQGGRIKTDWSQSPFVSYYKNYNVTWCRPSPGVAWCGDEPADSTLFNLSQQDLIDLQWVRDNGCVIYDYCADTVRFNATTMPKECKLPRKP